MRRRGAATHVPKHPDKSSNVLLAAIEDGPVVSLDSVNAFNTINRQTAMDYLKARPIIYSQMYAPRRLTMTAAKIQDNPNITLFSFNIASFMF